MFLSEFCAKRGGSVQLSFLFKVFSSLFVYLFRAVQKQNVLFKFPQCPVCVVKTMKFQSEFPQMSALKKKICSNLLPIFCPHSLKWMELKFSQRFCLCFLLKDKAHFKVPNTFCLFSFQRKKVLFKVSTNVFVPEFSE